MVFTTRRPRTQEGNLQFGDPHLGVCYGMQLICDQMGARSREARNASSARRVFIDSNKDLFANLPTNITCWMSHSDQIASFRRDSPRSPIRSTRRWRLSPTAPKDVWSSVPPEVAHTSRGVQVLSNFIFGTCGACQLDHG